MKRAALLLCVVLAPLARPAYAHESRPAYLEIKETSPGRFDMIWRTPVLSGMRLPVVPRLPEGVRDLTAPVIRELSDSLVERRMLAADSGTLAGARIDFAGLQGTITDVLVRVDLRDGNSSTKLVRASQPWVEIAAASRPRASLGDYVRRGAEQILLRFDFLILVLALMLIARHGRVLLVTISAFTVAYSITLALATLGFVDLAAPPVKAATALAALLGAVELVCRERGQIGLMTRRPWLAAFWFGLLLGPSIASGLSASGLPRADVPLALLAFNAGVECGLLAFSGTVLAAAALARRAGLSLSLGVAARWTPYAVGSLAAFSFFEGLARF